MKQAERPLCVFKDIVTVLLRWKSMPTSQSPHLYPLPLLMHSQHALLRQQNKEEEVKKMGCGYSAEVIPWLMWHVCLRPCRLLTARIIIVIMWQLKRKRTMRTGWRGLWSKRWMCTDYKAVGNALRWQSILTPPSPSLHRPPPKLLVITAHPHWYPFPINTPLLP